MNQYNFILQQFGLQHIKPLFYPKGEELKGGHTDVESVQRREMQDRDFAMTATARQGMFGTPIFADLTLQSAQGGGTSITLDWALMEVSQSKNIVKTAIQGRPGTVKEYISEGDYLIHIRGGLFSPYSYAYPEGDMKVLLELLELPTAIYPVSSYLRQFNIFSVVVEDYRFIQREGMQNIQLFEIKCVSDNEIELRERDA